MLFSQIYWYVAKILIFYFQEFNLALWQCYGRYLRHFGDNDMEEILEVSEFKRIFFPAGFSAEDAGFTVRTIFKGTMVFFDIIYFQNYSFQLGCLMPKFLYTYFEIYFQFRALMGRTICAYQSVKMTDSKLQNTESVEKCIKLLNFLRIMTQVILPKESLCWLVFNGECFRNIIF